MQVNRLGLRHCGVTKKFSFSEILAERVVNREALKILAGAVEKLRRGGEIDKVELGRLRTTIAATGKTLR